MVARHDPCRVVWYFADACVFTRDHSYALGILSSELADAISLLPDDVREEFLERLVKHTATMKGCYNAA
jgi:hypothetical protein